MDYKLKAKLFISGKIVLKTGMHIGGSKATLEIGGVDSPVIKTPNGVPFIPGSSIKGKMRTLLGLAAKSESVKDDPDYIQKIFGNAKKDKKENASGFGPTRIIVRDAFLDMKDFKDKFASSNLDFEYSEVKFENTINRIDSRANPRQIERVPAGASFDFEIVYNILDDSDDVDNIKYLLQGMLLLEDDFIGGSGSRGYGRIEFKDIEMKLRTIEFYIKEKDEITISEYPSLLETRNNLDSIISNINETIRDAIA